MWTVELLCADGQWRQAQDELIETEDAARDLARMLEPIAKLGRGVTQVRARRVEDA
jgi:hypothetical protein